MDSDEAFFDEIRACTRCKGLPLGPKPIFQAGRSARILIVGQAPGRITHARGRPFDDASGDRLRGWLGVDRETFYDPEQFALIPMGFCYPGTGKSGDLPPRPECAETWRSPMLSRLPQIRLTLVLGRYALAWHLPERARDTLKVVVADWRRHWPALLALPHPSPRNQRWFRDNPHFERDVLPALRRQVRELVPGPAPGGAS